MSDSGWIVRGQIGLGLHSHRSRRAQVSCTKVSSFFGFSIFNGLCYCPLFCFLVICTESINRHQKEFSVKQDKLSTAFLTARIRLCYKVSKILASFIWYFDLHLITKSKVSRECELKILWFLFSLDSDFEVRILYCYFMQSRYNSCCKVLKLISSFVTTFPNESQLLLLLLISCRIG